MEKRKLIFISVGIIIFLILLIGLGVGLFANSEKFEDNLEIINFIKNQKSKDYQEYAHKLYNYGLDKIDPNMLGLETYYRFYDMHHKNKK
jgi:hypothetical protein